MTREHKEAIIRYIRNRDQTREVVRELTPSEDFSGGRIQYNSTNLRLHRAISQLTDEEYVRAYLLVFLVHELGYQAHPDVIELEREYTIGRPGSRARVDIIVRYPPTWDDEEQQGRAFLFIECKAPLRYESDREYLRGQVFAVARQEEPHPRYGVYYTTRAEDEEVFDRALIIDLDEFTTFEAWDEVGQPSTDLLPGTYGRPERIRFANIEEPAQAERPLRTDVTRAEFERLRHDLHQIVWGGGGTNNNDVFVMLVRLFLCRIYDELEAARGATYQFQRESKRDGSLETPDEVVTRMSALFAEAAQAYLGYTPEEIGETTPFERRKIAPAKVAYVVEQLQSISLTENTSRGEGDLLGSFFEAIVAQDFTQTKGQFFTPVSLVQFCLRMASLGEEAKETFVGQRDEQGRPTGVRQL